MRNRNRWKLVKRWEGLIKVWANNLASNPIQSAFNVPCSFCLHLAKLCRQRRFQATTLQNSPVLGSADALVGVAMPILKSVLKILGSLFRSTMRHMNQWEPMELLHGIIAMQRHSVAAHPAIQGPPWYHEHGHWEYACSSSWDSSFGESTSWNVHVVFLALVAQPVENVLKILLSLF
jgi:hypothetical protein